MQARARAVPLLTFSSFYVVVVVARRPSVQFDGGADSERRLHLQRSNRLLRSSFVGVFVFERSASFSGAPQC